MNHPHQNTGKYPQIRLVAWETTRRCNLSCKHCRAAAEDHEYNDELSTKEAKKLLDEIAKVGSPIIILTGGEPLLREDIFELSEYGDKLGLKMVMAPNGTLVTEENALLMKKSGIKRISVSIDGSSEKSHDEFRGVKGAFKSAMQGIENAKKAGIEFQLNTTITKDNINEIPDILNLAVELGAAAHHIFLLVPTGRGKYIAEKTIDAKTYEKTLNWFYDQRDKVPLQLKATCAPHYYRILRQRAKREGVDVNFQTFGLDAVTRGCLGGIGFCFISHTGQVQPCGFLELDCGNVRQNTFEEIWENSKIFNDLRDYEKLKGKCGICSYNDVCGGCRARAYEATNDHMEEEPFCLYQPAQAKSNIE